jgi:hypothetical protein
MSERAMYAKPDTGVHSTIEVDGKLYACPVHGVFRIALWEDAHSLLETDDKLRLSSMVSFSVLGIDHERYRIAPDANGNAAVWRLRGDRWIVVI